jgi:hypothetical protein
LPFLGLVNPIFFKAKNGFFLWIKLLDHDYRIMDNKVMDKKVAKFISLKDASALCKLSPDYLNLIARKGYLRAVKKGRNWVTKNEWLEDYLCRVERKHNRAIVTRDTVLPAAPGTMPDSRSGQAPAPAVPVPAMDPIAFNFLLPQSARTDSGLRVGKFASFVCLAAAAAFAFAAILFSQRDVFSAGMKISLASTLHYGSVPAIREYATPKNIMASLDDATSGASRFFIGAMDSLKNAGSQLASYVRYAFFGKTEVVEVTETTTKSIGDGAVDKTVLEKSADALEKNIVSDTKGRINDFKEEFGLSGQDRNPAQGMVVAPSTGDANSDDELQNKLQKNFSDEVTVEPSDENSGIVVPQFRDGPGDEYIYMLVPVDDSQ